MIELIHVAHAAAESTESTSVVGLFGLDWKLFIAQLINFAIVMLVLWKWVFTPVTKGLQARTKKIEQSLKDAEDISVQKQEFEKYQKNELAKARSESARIIAEATTNAETAKQDILNSVKAEQAQLIEQGKAQLEAEKNKAMLEAKKEIATLVISATQKILGEKLTGDKDKELIKKSLQEVTKA